MYRLEQIRRKDIVIYEENNKNVITFARNGRNIGDCNLL